MTSPTDIDWVTLSGELATSHETSGADFFPWESLPPLCPRRAARHCLDLAWQDAANPSLPTAFD